MKKLVILMICLLGTLASHAQSSTANDNILYLNVFINSNKTIYVEEDQTSFQNVQKQVAEILRKLPFKVDRKIIFRIFGDKDLDLGYISDVNTQMNKAIEENLQTKRYLLETKKLNIDGENWFQKIDLKALEQ